MASLSVVLPDMMLLPSIPIVKFKAQAFEGLEVGWQKTFGEAGEGTIRSIQRTADGGRILAGTVRCLGTVGCNAYLVKTEASGNLEWQKAFEGEGSDRTYSVQHAAEGSNSPVGATDSFDVGGYDAWLAKTDPDDPVSSWRSDIQPSDIFLHHTSGSPSYLVFYTHAGIRVGGGKVAEARDPVVIFPPDNGIAHCGVDDRHSPHAKCVSVYKLKNHVNPAVRAKAVAAADWAVAQAKRAFTAYLEFYPWLDHLASASSPARYCSELAWASCCNQGVDFAAIGSTGPSFSPIAVSHDCFATDELEMVAQRHDCCPAYEHLGMTVRTDCPVGPVLTDPYGRSFSKESGEMEGACCLEIDTDGNGEAAETVGLGSRLLGGCIVLLSPQEGASPSDAFSLEAEPRVTTYSPARDVRISDIPAEGYLVAPTERACCLAEGGTAGDFKAWVPAQNPNLEAAHISLGLMAEHGLMPVPEIGIAVSSSHSFNAVANVTSCDVSALVGSGSPVIAERVTYRASRILGHDLVGYAP